MAFFCNKTGVRIAKPGVCKACDPIEGHDEVVEVDGVEKIVGAKAEKAEAPKAAENKAATSSK